MTSQISRFDKLVYDWLTKVPKGKVVTYGQIARGVSREGAYRAVGNSLHRNPNAPIIPCHRVVNQRGYLAKKFKDGLAVQIRLLEMEGVVVNHNRVNLEQYQWVL